MYSWWVWPVLWLAALLGLAWTHSGHHEHGKREVFEQEQSQIREKLADTVDVSRKTNLTEEELAFYYFHLHDRDNNTKLDGLEIFKAIIDVHETEKIPPPNSTEMESLIDSVLQDHDLNSDGYIDYGEYLRAQAIEREREKEEEARKARVGRG